MSPKTKPSRSDYINNFLKLGKTAINEYKTLVESFDSADVEKVKEKFGKLIPEIFDENKRKVINRRLGIKNPRRGNSPNWFNYWQKSSSDQVENFKRDYQDKTVSVETLLSQYSIFNGDYKKMYHAARRLKVKGSRVNQHTIKNTKQVSIKSLLEKELDEKKKVNLAEMSNVQNISKNELRKTLKAISENKGIRLKETGPDIIETAQADDIEPMNIYEKDTTLIAISGLFMGSTRQRRHLLEVLKTQIIPKEKPDFLIIDGNIAVGKPEKDETHFLDKFNYFLDSLVVNGDEENGRKISESDKLFHAQVEYIVKYFPKFGNLKVQLVGGYRDTMFKGKNIAQAVCFKREDLKYRGTRIGKFRLRSGGEIVVISPITKPWRTEQPSWPLQREADDYIRSLKGKEEMPELILVGGHGVWNEVASDPKPYLIGLPNLSEPKRGESVGVVVIKVSDGKVDKVTFINLSQYLDPDILINDYDKMTKKQKSIVDLLKISPRSGGELSRQIDISKTEIAQEKSKINNLVKDLIKFSEDSNQYKLDVNKPHLPNCNTKLYENLKTQCGLYLCCTHLGSRQAQPNLLKKDLVEIAIKEKVDFIAVHGDLTNGIGHHHVNEKLANIITNYTIQQVFAADIFAEIIKKVTEALKKQVYFLYIPGNHDKWIEEHGIIALAHFDDRLKILLGSDLNQLVIKGFDQNINGLKIHMIHYESGGGKIKSRSSKNVIDNQIPYIIKDVKQDFHVLSGGNFHNNWFGFYKGYLAIMLGCMQAQIEYEAGKGLFPDIGFPIIRTYLKNDKLFKSEIKYYDLTKKAVSLSNEEFGKLQLEFAQNIHNKPS